MSAHEVVTTVQVPVIECATCKVPYVLRLSLSIESGGAQWLYQRDCRHRTSAPAEVENAAPLVAVIEIARVAEAIRQHQGAHS